MSRPWITPGCVLLAALAPACGATSPEDGTTTERPPAAPAELQVEVQPAEGVTAMQPACGEGAGERCDAIDDDCDGRVDEGCGFGGGPLQLTLAWGAGVDLDLEVIEPGGARLGGDATRTQAGGRLDRTGEGRCAGEGMDERVEDAHWTERPPAGTYEVAVRHVEACEASGPATATLTVSAAGRVLGSYNRTVPPGATERVATVVVNGR